MESEIWHKWTYLQNRNRLIDIENRLVVAKEWGRERDGLGVWGWCKLLHIEWINNKVLLHSTGNYIQSPVINHNGKEYKKRMLGFPGGAVVESLPANAGDTGSSPGLGRSHMPRSSWAREPQLLSLRVWSLCSARTEAAIVRGPRTAMKSGPHLPQLEKALEQKRRPNTAK